MKSFFKGFIDGVREGFVFALRLFSIIAVVVFMIVSIILLAEVHPVLVIPFIFLSIIIIIAIGQGYQQYQKEQDYREIIADYEEDIKTSREHLDNNPNLYSIERESYLNRINYYEDKKKWYEDRLKEIRGEVK